MTTPKRIILALGAVLTASLAGCATGDFDYDALPDVVRIESEPAGVELQLSGYVARFVTPCEIKRETLRGRTLTLTHAGYLPFQGMLGDLAARERGVYRVDLRKR